MMSKRKPLQCLAILLAVALLLSVVPVLSIGAVSISNIEAAMAATESIDGYDVNNEGNLFGETSPGNVWVDAKLEDVTGVDNKYDGTYRSPAESSVTFVDEGIPVKSGERCAKITGKTIFHLPNTAQGWEKNTYYLFSFYIYAEKEADFGYAGIGFRDRDTNWSQFIAPTLDFYNKANLKAGEWNKVSIVIYSGKRTLIAMTIGDVATATNCVYLDDFSLVKLPDAVQTAAKAFDEYGGDYSTFGSEEQALLTAVGTTFAENSAYASLTSPVRGGNYAENYRVLKTISNPNNILNKEAHAVATKSIDGYDISHEGNLFGETSPGNVWVDAKLEDVTGVDNKYDGTYRSPAESSVTFADEGIPVKSGERCAKITGKTIFHLPNTAQGWEKNTYYLFSFYIYAEKEADFGYAGIGFRDRDTNWSQFIAPTLDFYNKANLKAGEWNKVSIVIYSGKRSLIAMTIGDVATAENCVYLDDFSLVKLPDSVQTAAKAFDEYGGDYSNSGSEEEALVAAVGSTFAAGSVYADLCSPLRGGAKYADDHKQLMVMNDPNSIIGKEAKVQATYNIAGYDVGHSGNLFTNVSSGDAFVDASLEDVAGVTNDAYRGYRTPAQSSVTFADENIPAKSGEYCAKITGETIFHLPRPMEKNTYYLFSFYVYTKNDVSKSDYWAASFHAREDEWPQVAAPSVDCYNKADLKNGQWNKVSFVIYSGKRTFLFMTLGASIRAEEQYFYLDDFSLIELPDSVQVSAQAFDEYTGDYSTNGAEEQELLAAIGSEFALGSVYANLCSPIRGGAKYSDGYRQLMAINNPNSIIGKEAKVTGSYNIVGYDVTHTGNLFKDRVISGRIDASLEHADEVTDKAYRNYRSAAEASVKFADEGIPVKSGEYCAKITGETIFTLPNVENNSYYLLSFYVYTKGDVSASSYWGAAFHERTDWGQIAAGSVDAFQKADLQSGKWSKVSFVIYTGKRNILFMTIGASVNSADKHFYLDDFSLVKLPDEVQGAAQAFDEYAGDYSEFDETLAAAVGTVFASGTYLDLCSPTYAGEKYSTFYNLLTGFRPGAGFITIYPANTSKDEHNFVANSQCDDVNFWSNDAKGYGTVAEISDAYAYDGKTSLKVLGNGSTYVKWLTVEPDTYYYLSLYGMTPQDTKLNDIHFGFMDTNGIAYKNSASGDESAVHLTAAFELITIPCQDGLWHNRTYRFKSGSNTQIGFYVTGTNGVMYLDEIRVFKVTDAIQITDPEKNGAEGVEEDISAFTCKDEDNLIPNGFFDKATDSWKDDYAFGRFVEVVESEGNNMLYYRNGYKNCYYMPEFAIEPNTTYTFSFWVKELSGSGAAFGLASGEKPRHFLQENRTFSEEYGAWEMRSITFYSADETSVCFALYDNGGEAVFDNFRLFKAEDGIETALAKDEPVGGDEFEAELKNNGKPIKGVEEEDDETPEEDDPASDGEDETTPDDEGDLVPDDEGDVTPDEGDNVTPDDNGSPDGDKDVIAGDDTPDQPAKLSIYVIVLIAVSAALLVLAIVVLVIVFAKKKRKNKHATT